MDVLNTSLSPATPSSLATPDSPYMINNFVNTTFGYGMMTKPRGPVLMLIKVVYTIGIIGNAAAIVSLRRGERRMRNRKHLLLLTSLAVNDLVALLHFLNQSCGPKDYTNQGKPFVHAKPYLAFLCRVGLPLAWTVLMICSLVISEHIPKLYNTKIFCATRVVSRIFGIGSVCIAVTMALERYLALTRPFFYQKKITFNVIRTTLLASWIWAAILTCAPIFGLGIYFDEVKMVCTRYRNAVTTTDYAYAISYVVFGTFLCVILVYCNLAVIQVLYAISSPGAGGQAVVRRLSRSSCRQRQRNLTAASSVGLHHNAATAEEVAFSRLMAMLSVLFMICWLPQMITSSLYLTLSSDWWESKFLIGIATISDLLMLLNYVLNPILYVLMRQRWRLSLSAFCRSVVHCFQRQNHKTSTESMKMSCCAQETLVISDSAGIEAQLAARRSNRNS